MTFKDVVEAALSLSPEEQSKLMAILANTQEDDVNELIDLDEDFMSSAEIEALLHQGRPKTGAQIAQSPYIGVWADEGVTDGLIWVTELKRKRRERKSW